jgi:purine-binding chemotaxis protein CheW
MAKKLDPPEKNTATETAGEIVDDVVDDVVEEAWEDLFSGEQTQLKLATEETYLDAYNQTPKIQKDQKKVLAFWLGREEYGMDLLDVNEILRPKAITPVPRTRDFVLGVISVRGEVLPVIDLRRRMGLEHGSHTRRQSDPDRDGQARILVVSLDEEQFGLIVDAVSGVTVLDTHQIELSPPVVSRQEGELVTGIGRVGARMIILVRLDAVLDFEAAWTDQENDKPREGS